MADRFCAEGLASLLRWMTGRYRRREIQREKSRGRVGDATPLLFAIRKAFPGSRGCASIKQIVLGLTSAEQRQTAHGCLSGLAMLTSNLRAPGPDKRRPLGPSRLQGLSDTNVGDMAVRDSIRHPSIMNEVVLGAIHCDGGPLYRAVPLGTDEKTSTWYFPTAVLRERVRQRPISKTTGRKMLCRLYTWLHTPTL